MASDLKRAMEILAVKRAPLKGSAANYMRQKFGPLKLIVDGQIFPVPDELSVIESLIAADLIRRVFGAQK